eukprot:9904151-Prorocentrum_lima.AAC.1
MCMHPFVPKFPVVQHLRVALLVHLKVWRLALVDEHGLSRKYLNLDCDAQLIPQALSEFELQVSELECLN